MSKFCPLVTCLPTDRLGNPVSPRAPDCVHYSALPAREEGAAAENLWSVAMEGYVSLFSEGKRVSPPIPFCILETLRIFVPWGGELLFRTEAFHCWAAPLCPAPSFLLGDIRLLISIKCFATSEKQACLQVPQLDCSLRETGRLCVDVKRIYDGARLLGGCCLYCKNALLEADIYQYNAIADGTQRTFRDSDELRLYGGRGILSPQEVSYCDMFVNAMLQPRKNYILKKGELTFTTQDIPSKGQTVMILFVTWRDADGRIMQAESRRYNAVSDGRKLLYTNADELKEYGERGIPSPCEVSFFNLYINGVLQPCANYCVRKGFLQLTTADAPTRGSLIILESVVIRSPSGRLFRAETYSYHARSDGGKIYSDREEIKMYGGGGIPCPDDASYQNLFVNGVSQPEANYRVRKGCLVLETQDAPTVGAPITLQSVSGPPAAPCCETKLSEAALAQWRKQFSHIRDPFHPGEAVVADCRKQSEKFPP